MAKVRKVFICQNCGASSSKWVGKCQSCSEWNTYVEEVVERPSAKEVPAWVDTDSSPKRSAVRQITQLEEIHEQRNSCPDGEFNRVLGGGIVPGSLVLIGGEPGIGKSTLLLQMALRTSDTVLYVSGEESAQQLRMRAGRIGIQNEECYILPTTDIGEIFKRVKEVKPDIVVVDSIQTLYSKVLDSAPGSISQIRECAGQLLRFAKESDTPVFLIGHITKDGQIAGPKVLEHMVDTVLQFEGDRHHSYRILRAVKNRFGSASELGIYEMQSDGLREVENPSEVLISQNEKGLSGISITAALEGARPLLLETQALVSTAVYGTPQRNANGYDLRRLNMLLAVLEKRCGFQLGSQDVFVNVAGGLKVDDPGIDLGIAVAILSSYENTALPPKDIYIGEIGLSGEIRSVNRLEQRIAEAAKLGYQRVIAAKSGLEKIDIKGIQLHGVDTIGQVYTALFNE